MEKAIEIQHLNKSYGSVKAVQDISFQVKQGELFAFLGINGAGKSTTISILCGLLKKDGGSVFVEGKNIDEIGSQLGQKIGVVFQDSVLDAPLSVKDNLKYRASLYGICGKVFETRLKELVELFDFSDYINRPIGKLSGGQRRRIDIARALIHRPSILILDEPTTGLDPQTRKNIWRIIEKLQKEEGLTVFLTTHYMEEASSADYVVILDQGKIITEGTPQELKNKYTKDTLSLYGVDEKQVQLLNKDYISIPQGYQLQLDSTLEATQMILSHPELFKDYEIVKGNMDDVFLAATGKELKGEKL